MNQDEKKSRGQITMKIVMSTCAFFSMGVAKSFGAAKEFRPLEFTTRAQCAINSNSPTRSLMVIGDGEDAGRLAFNLQSKLGAKVSEGEALKLYRQSVATTFKIVIEKLLANQLPLVSGARATADLRSTIEKCEQQKGCGALTAKIAELWTAGVPPVNSGSPTKGRLGCHKITKFNALHGALNRDRPTRLDLDEIGASLNSANQQIEACDADSRTTDRQFLLQFELLALDEKVFEATGFDFWNSVKTYVVWAWQNAPEVRKKMGRFGSLFPNMALEEELLLVPNGCRSLSVPKCDLQGLSLNAIRELAKPPTVASGFERNLPPGPQADLVKSAARSVNDGFLGTNSADAAAWTANFSKRFNNARWVSRNKLQGAIRQYQLTEKISNERLVQDIESDLIDFNGEKNYELLAQTAAVCLEARLLGDAGFKIMRPDFANVIAVGSQLIPEHQSTSNVVQLAAESAANLARRLQPLCDRLEKSFFRTRDADTKPYVWRYVSTWARERLDEPMLPSTTKSKNPEESNIDATSKKRGWNRPQPYLELNGDGNAPIEICRSPLTCAQQAFKSYVDIYYVSTWAAAFQDVRKLKDANLFNPYAELTACKSYDPWFSTNQANAHLAQRLVLSAVFAPLPVPIFFESVSQRPTVVAMKSVAGTRDDGIKTLNFTPEFESQNTRETFFADLGPLAGAPCAVQYSSSPTAPFQVYGISGVTLNYCTDQRGGDKAAEENLTVDGRAKYSICGGCTVNATSAASVLSYAAPPGPARFVVGAMRAFGIYSGAIQDWPNRPLTFTVNPDFVADTYRENGDSIPKRCVDSLISGYRCFEDTCAAHAANEFESRYGERALTASILYDDDVRASSSGTQRSGTVGLKIAGCDAEVTARVQCNHSKRRHQVLGSFGAFAGACKSTLSKPAGGSR